MNFKELLQQDLRQVFLNSDEFAEKHLINGIEADIVFDDDELSRLAADKQEEGLYKNKKLIKLSEDVLGGKPKIGTPIDLDGRIYRVYNSFSEDGLLSIILEANRI